jgi:hypothetical protein
MSAEIPRGSFRRKEQAWEKTRKTKIYLAVGKSDPPSDNDEDYRFVIKEIPFGCDEVLDDPEFDRPKEVESLTDSVRKFSDLRPERGSSASAEWEGIAPIHDWGAERESDPENSEQEHFQVWLALDRYQSNLTNLQVVRPASLHNLLTSIVQTLLVLNRAWKRGHGNLSDTNIFFKREKASAISEKELRTAKPILADPDFLERDADKIRARDLNWLGSCLARRVLGESVGGSSRILTPEDLSHDETEWTRFDSKNGLRWRDLCRKLIHADPQITLEEVATELEALRPGLKLPVSIIAIGAVAVLGLIIGLDMTRQKKKDDPTVQQTTNGVEKPTITELPRPVKVKVTVTPENAKIAYEEKELTNGRPFELQPPTENSQKTYSIWITSPGYKSETINLKLSSGQETNVHVTLKRMSTKVSLMIDRKDLEPLWVRLKNSANQLTDVLTASGSEGLSTNLDVGFWEVSTEHRFFGLARTNFYVPDNGGTNVILQFAYGGVKVDVPPEVIDAQIQLDGTRMTNGPSGTFFMVPPGLHEVRAWAPRYMTNKLKLQVLAGIVETNVMPLELQPTNGWIVFAGNGTNLVELTVDNERYDRVRKWAPGAHRLEAKFRKGAESWLLDSATADVDVGKTNFVTWDFAKIKIEVNPKTAFPTVKIDGKSLIGGEFVGRVGKELRAQFDAPGYEPREEILTIKSEGKPFVIELKRKLPTTGTIAKAYALPRDVSLLIGNKNYLQGSSLNPGPVQVVAKFKEWFLATNNVTVIAGQDTPLPWKFRDITIATTPAKSLVVLNGNTLKEATWTGIEGGVVNLSISSEGYQMTNVVRAINSTSAEWRFDLAKLTVTQTGVVDLGKYPAGLAFYVDGKEYKADQPLDPGVHQLVAQYSEGKRKWTNNVTVTASKSVAAPWQFGEAEIRRPEKMDGLELTVDGSPIVGNRWVGLVGQYVVKARDKSWYEFSTNLVVTRETRSPLDIGAVPTKVDLTDESNSPIDSGGIILKLNGAVTPLRKGFLREGASYKFEVSKPGFETNTVTHVASRDRTTIPIKLAKVPPPPPPPKNDGFRVQELGMDFVWIKTDDGGLHNGEKGIWVAKTFVNREQYAKILKRESENEYFSNKNVFDFITKLNDSDLRRDLLPPAVGDSKFTLPTPSQYKLIQESFGIPNSEDKEMVQVREDIVGVTDVRYKGSTATNFTPFVGQGGPKIYFRLGVRPKQ